MPNGASIFWINGKRIASYEKLGKSYDQEEIELGKKIIEIRDETNEIDLIIQVSNYNKFGSGIVHPIKFGKSKGIFSSRILAVSLDVFMAACLLLIFFYHMSLYFFRRKEKAALFLSLFSLIYVFRVLTTNEQILSEMQFIHWQIIFRIDFLTIALIVPAFLKYIELLFSEIVVKKIN